MRRCELVCRLRLILAESNICYIFYATAQNDGYDTEIIPDRDSDL